MPKPAWGDRQALRVRGVVGALFLIAAVLVAISAVFLYFVGQVALESNRRLTAHRAALSQLERFLSGVKDAETGQRGFLLTGQTEYLEPYQRSRTEVREHLAALEKLSATHELPSAEVAQLARLTEEKLSEIEQTLALVQAGKKTAALEVVRGNRGRDLMEAIRLDVDRLEREVYAQLEETAQRSDRATRQRTLTFLLAGVLNLGFLGWAYHQISREVQAREEAESQLRQSHAQLEQRVAERTADLANVNRELEAFGYSVSHDLRAPLRHISSFIQLLERSSGPGFNEEDRRYVRVIADAAKRMGHLIDDLLALSRLGRATMNETEVSLGALVEEARQELAPTVAGRAIEWEVGFLPTVRADPALLRSALVNLLSNALKYTRQRNPARIAVGSRHENGELVCFIRDNGAGFEMQFADKLFGVFQRLHPSEKFEGTGIGLASVRRIIQRHGGKTWAEGEPDRGATFYFSLPGERVMAA